MDPELKQQIDDLRKHKTPEQAGVLTLGASPEAKAKQEQAFLDKVTALMVHAHEVATAKSNEAAKALEQQAVSAKTAQEATALRTRAAAYRASNDAARGAISGVSPGLGRGMAVADVRNLTLPPASTPGPNIGGLIRAFEQDMSADNSAPPPAFIANDPAFSDLGERCKDAAKQIDVKIKSAKPGSDEAKYLSELKAALDMGTTNPPAAVQQVRNLSGLELAEVLRDLGAPKKTK